MKKQCLECNRIFKKDFRTSKKHFLTITKFCSIKCKGLSSRGKYKPIKGKLLINCKVCNKKFEIYPYRKNTVKFCSRTCKGKAMNGKRAPRWKGGISKTLEYKRFYYKLMKSKRRKAAGSHTLQEWQILKSFYNYMCLCCKKQEPEVKLTEDHIIPLSRGGTNYIDNIQPLCMDCNARKYTNIIDYRQKEYYFQNLN